MGLNLLSFYQNKVKKEWKIAFFSAFIACLLIHIYKFTNTLPNHDSPFNVYVDQNMTASGRWFLQYACGISSYFDLPWLNGFLSAAYLGIVSVCIVGVFGISNPVVIVLSAILLSACPCTTETFFFEFTADGYFLGFAFSAAAAWLSCRGTRFVHYMLSAVLLCLSCAIYQAYISFAMVLCVCYMVNSMLENTMTVKDAWKWIRTHVIIYAVAMLVYFVLWKTIMLVSNIQPNSYQGIDSVGKLSFHTLLNGAVKSISNLLIFFLEWNIFEHPITLYAILNIVFIICFVAVVVVAVVKSGIYKNGPSMVLVMIGLIVCVPMISIWNFVSETITYRSMMLHSVIVMYIFAIILFDRWVHPKWSTVFGFFMAIMMFNNAIIANISYFYLEKCAQKSMLMGMQIVERINEEDEFEAIAFVGNRIQEASLSGVFPAQKIQYLTNVLETDLLYEHSIAYKYLSTTFDFKIAKLPDYQLKILKEHPMVSQMGVWPAEDSVQVIDGVLVIKLAEATE